MGPRRPTHHQGLTHSSPSLTLSLTLPSCLSWDQGATHTPSDQGLPPGPPPPLTKACPL